MSCDIAIGRILVRDIKRAIASLADKKESVLKKRSGCFLERSARKREAPVTLLLLVVVVLVFAKLGGKMYAFFQASLGLLGNYMLAHLHYKLSVQPISKTGRTDSELPHDKMTRCFLGGSERVCVLAHMA